MAEAVDRILQDGLQAHLPPHLSTLLGISNERESPVVQAILRSGDVVQGFDVSNANHNDVVLFIVDESTKNQTLYLTSPRGELRKVVSVKEGTGAVHAITAEDKEAFAKQKQFWLDRLAPIPNSK